jgi:hypothetical protein
LTAAGCSGSSAPAAAGVSASPSPVDLSPVAAVQAAARATQETSTVRVETSSVTRLGGQSTTMSGTGAFDYQRHRGQFDMTINGGAASLGALSGKPGSTLSLKVVLDNGKTYLGGLPVVPSGTWIESDAGAGLGGSASMDPTKSLQQLDQVAAGGVHRVGAGQVRGTAVTHYQAMIDPSKAFSALGLNSGPTASLAKSVTQPIPVDVYIDAQQRIRELDETADLTLPASLGGGTSHTKVTSQFFDYGAPVEITVPTNVQRLDLPSG